MEKVPNIINSNKCKKIKKGSIIGLICPSSKNQEKERLQNFLAYLTKQGFKYKLGESVFATDGYLAGNDLLRANDLNKFFLDDEVDAILCFRGGYGASRFLDLIDYENIKKHPKLLVGFSDVTVLLNAIYQKTLIPTLHGEMGVTFKEEEDLSFTNLIETLLGTAPCDLTKMASNLIVKSHNKESVEGVIVGGNLTLVCQLMGTPYEIDTKNKILLLEDVGEAPYRIDGYLSTLRLAGKLKDAKAIIFGYFTNCDKDETDDGKSLQEVLDEYTKDLNCPILFNFPTGHNKPFVSVPIGVKVRIDCVNQTVIVLESLFFDK